MAAKPTLPDSLEVDQRTLARIFGVHVRTVQRYDDEGLSETRVGDSATYDLAAAVAWLVESRVEKASGTDDATEYEEARTRRTKADAQIKEDELATRRGMLLRAEEVIDRVRKPLEAVDARLRSAPRKFAKEWAAKIGTTQAQAIAMIGELVEDVRSDVRLVFEEEDGDVAA